MNLTGSIADAARPLSVEMMGSVTGEGGGVTGSSFIDTVALALFALPTYLLQVVAGIGADLGSTMGGPVS